MESLIHLNAFNAACAALGRESKLPDVTGKSEIEAGRETAAVMLDAIIDDKNMKANDGKPWVADLADTTQRKYHPVFLIEDDEAALRGFRLSFRGYDFGNGSADLGARHAAKTSDIAIEMGEQYPELYKEYRS